MVNRLTGALVRAFLVMILIVTPSVILPGTGTDTQQMVALIALFGGALTFIEYNAVYPSLLEFRDAPPFNRIRFVMLFALVFSLSAIQAAALQPTPFTRLFEAVGYLLGHGMDFPYSPVRLAALMIGEGASAAELAMLRSAAGTAYIISLIGLSFYVVIFRLKVWPSRHQAFNVWVNLPTFEPTGGGDVVDRLERDARVNLSLGFLLPFILPAMVNILTGGMDPHTLTSPQTLIWVMAAWAFLPASLLMRGIAMGRVAAMIRSKRAAGGMAPASASFATA